MSSSPSRPYTSALYPEDPPSNLHPAQHLPEPLFTAEERTSAAQPQLAHLLTTQHWSLTPDGKGLEKEFRFKGFRRGAWRFMAEVAEAINAANHHPTWTNTFNRVRVVWTTHRPEGLSWRDIRLAERCEEVYERVRREEEEAARETKKKKADEA